MNTCSLSEAKAALGKLADRALKGRPTVIIRGGKLVILQAYEPQQDQANFDALIEGGIDSPHLPVNDALWAKIRRRGRRLAQTK
jgi:hypothetical protein